jgi:pimeloyl-ACP methyl ester carboxylesterase
MAPGFADVREVCAPYAERFAQAGIAVLLFDYRCFGASDGEPRQLLGIGRQLEDWEAALAHVGARPEVDAQQVAIWGTSFSGGHVLALAARHPELRACIAQVPFVSGLASARATSMRDSSRLTLAAIRDVTRMIARRPPYRVLIVGPPDQTRALPAPDALEGRRRIMPPGHLEDTVAARISFGILAANRSRAAARIRCPVLMCVVEKDHLCPVDAAVKVARRIPSCTLKRYPGGHFDIYGADFEAVVRDQLAFLQEHLLSGRPLARSAAMGPSASA